MPSRLAIPAELKRITQYIRRAEELDVDKRPQSRIVAYYCRQYAVQTGIELSNSEASRLCLSQILSSLEQEKQAISVFSREECIEICRDFAVEIFNKADKEDRSGVAGKNTAKAFYASAVFLKILEQFGEMDEELVEKWNYARWKAMDINKAINEGRQVIPGGHGEMQAFQDVNNLQVKDEGTEVDLLLGPPPAYPVEPLPPLPTEGPKSPSTTPSSQEALDDALDDALELTRFALIALEAKDTTLGRNRLEQALFCLKSIQASSPTKTIFKSIQKSNNVVAETNVLFMTKSAISSLEKKDVIVGKDRIQQALNYLNHEYRMKMGY